MSSILPTLSGATQTDPKFIGTPTSSPSLTSASWSEPRSRTLIELLQTQVHLGKRSESGFRREAWAEVTSEFIKKYHGQWTREQLKNHFQILKSQYNTVRELRSHPDFQWDDSTHTVIGSAAAWDEYLKTRPKAKLFRDRGFPLYEVLDKLVGEPSGIVRKRNASQAFGSPLLVQPDVMVNPQLPTPNPYNPHIMQHAELNGSLPVSHDLSFEKGTSRPPGGSDTGSTDLIHVQDPKRMCSSQSFILTESLQQACKLEEDRIKQEAHDALERRLEAMIRRERFPNMKEALLIFGEASKDQFESSSQRMAAACVLRSEENAAFFCALPDDLRWDWLKSEVSAAENHNIHPMIEVPK